MVFSHLSGNTMPLQINSGLAAVARFCEARMPGEVLPQRREFDGWNWYNDLSVEVKMEVSINGGIQNGWFTRENPTKMHDWGVPLCLETFIYLYEIYSLKTKKIAPIQICVLVCKPVSGVAVELTFVLGPCSCSTLNGGWSIPCTVVPPKQLNCFSNSDSYGL